MRKTLFVAAACALFVAMGVSAFAGVGDSWISEVKDSGGNLNPNWVQNGTFSASSGKSTAPGLVGVGSLYGSTYYSVVGLKEMTTNMDVPDTGTYEVFVTWGANANRKPNIAYYVNGTKTLIDQSATANVWVSLGTYAFNAGTAVPVVVMNNVDANVSGSMYADSVKLTCESIIPEPGSFIALGTGLIALLGLRRRRA